MPADNGIVKDLFGFGYFMYICRLTGAFAAENRVHEADVHVVSVVHYTRGEETTAWSSEIALKKFSVLLRVMFERV
jgi:hypothetical protein